MSLDTEVKRLARQHTEPVIRRLAEIAGQSRNEAAAVSAAREILDRGWGKATQPVSGDAENPLQLLIQTGVPRADDNPDG